MAAPKPTWASILITQGIAIVVFLVVPALVTYMVPRTTIEMRRINDGASARITQYILLVFPCRLNTIEPVVKVESHVRSSREGYSTENDRIRKRKVTMAGDGSIWIIGRESKFQVQSTSTEAPLQAATIQAFLDSPAAEPLVLTTNAGWALTYLLGGTMTALSGFYCAGVILAVGRGLLRLGFPSGTDTAFQE
jgi:hypothetical protein